MKTKHIALIVLIFFAITSCTKKKEDLSVVTKQIQYLVELKNPDTIPDTRHEYLDDSTRIPFLKNIIDQVISGDVLAYQFEKDKLNPVPVMELKKRFSWDKSIPVPDSLDKINYVVDINKVTKIRYFEEWSMDKKNLVINKRVLAISLLLDNYDETGMYRGFEPLFYIFYDKDFRVKLQQQYKR